MTNPYAKEFAKMSTAKLERLIAEYSQKDDSYSIRFTRFCREYLEARISKPKHIKVIVWANGSESEIQKRNDVKEYLYNDRNGERRIASFIRVIEEDVRHWGGRIETRPNPHYRPS